MLLKYDFGDINDKAERILTDIKEIIKANNINLMNLFGKSDLDKVFIRAPTGAGKHI